MSAETVKPALRPVASIVVLGDSYDLAINGGGYRLVEHREPDAYGRPVARQVDFAAWVKDAAKAQAILDLLGESRLRITTLEEELSKAHGALQREAAPDSKPRRAPARELASGVSGILEEKAESQ